MIPKISTVPGVLVRVPWVLVLWLRSRIGALFEVTNEPGRRFGCALGEADKSFHFGFRKVSAVEAVIQMVRRFMQFAVGPAQILPELRRNEPAEAFRHQSRCRGG